MEPLLFIILALLIGALVRQFMSRTPLPYTVLLLLLGLILGGLVRLSWYPDILKEFAHAFQWAGEINPHVVLFVFLPTLIFEAAFGMDWHTFRKTSVNATLLAVPGIIIALIITAVILMLTNKASLGLDHWSWPIAFMFGAVISATDPVAVVAILKELGASKKLSTLIDGESILNDGTAIVLFMVFYLPLAGVAGNTNPVLDFLRVSVGGILLGLIVARFIMFWLKSVINDALIEISIMLAAAYFTFFIAEDFLHVSGVLGLFGFGISMASIGKTRISPEVKHFLGEFLELAVYIANTLIFFIVGVVIATRVHFSASDFIILLLLYVGIHLARAAMLAILYPFLKRSGYGITFKDSLIAWYGALRGAVALALALIVAGTEVIPQDIRDEFLFLTAGIVVLTLLINATTIKYLINFLGLTKISASKASIITQNNAWIRQSMESRWQSLINDRFFKNINQKTLRKFFPVYKDPMIQPSTQQDELMELRRMILEKEKASYWDQFNKGMMQSETVVKLSESISDLLDEEGRIELGHRSDLENLMRNPPFLKKIQAIPFLFRIYKNLNNNRLSLSFDFGRAFTEAQSKSLKLIEELKDSAQKAGKDTKPYELLQEEVTQNLIHGQTFVRNFKKLHPDIHEEVTTKLAIYALLDEEKRLLEDMLKSGRIELSDFNMLTGNINERLWRIQKLK